MPGASRYLSRTTAVQEGVYWDLKQLNGELAQAADELGGPGYLLPSRRPLRRPTLQRVGRSLLENRASPST